ncbi:MAG: HNH endonuclease, partial [Streptosporangiaceae bacterium]
AAARAAADTAARGGCAHSTASAGYRPAPRLREHVVARDLTCRFPFCGQPAWRGDLDHTQPWDAGGLTCSCNLGGLCRHHHMLKQHSGWRLTQIRPGVFSWVTPAGRTYTRTPARYAA